MNADVSLTSTIDFEALQRRLTDAERTVFDMHRKTIMAFIKAEWTGWLYAGRAKSADRLVSHDAWASELQTTESRAVLLVFNRARSRGKAYAAYVRRAGQPAVPVGGMGEAAVVWGKVVAELLPALKRDLIAEIARTLNKPARRQRLAGKSTTERSVSTRSR